MNAIRRMATTVCIGMLLAAGLAFAGAPTAVAEPGCGCECGYPMDAGKAGAMHHRHMGMQDNTAGCGKMQGHGGHMRGHHGMKGAGADRMDAYMKDRRDTIARLRAVEAKMDAFRDKDEAGFRAASLEHARLLTDLEEGRLRHMEGMTATAGPCGGTR